MASLLALGLILQVDALTVRTQALPKPNAAAAGSAVKSTSSSTSSDSPYARISTEVAESLNTHFAKYKTVKAHIDGLSSGFHLPSFSSITAAASQALNRNAPNLRDFMTLRPMLLLESIFPFNPSTAERQKSDLALEGTRFNACMDVLLSLKTLPSTIPPECTTCSTGICVACSSKECDQLQAQAEDLVASATISTTKLPEFAYFGRVYYEGEADGIEFGTSSVLLAAVAELSCAGSACTCTGEECANSKCSHEAAGSTEESKDELANLKTTGVAAEEAKKIIEDLKARNPLRLARFQAKLLAWSGGYSKKGVDTLVHAPARMMSFMTKPFAIAIEGLMKTGEGAIKVMDDAVQKVDTKQLIQLMILLAPGKYKGTLSQVGDALDAAEAGIGKVQNEGSKMSLGARIASGVGVTVDNSTGTMLLASVAISALVGAALMCM